MRDLQVKHAIHYTVEGEGPPVILVHGIASSLQGWASIRPDLIAAGLKVYALDLLGHGDSAKPEMPEHYNIFTIYRTFESWLGNLQLEQPAALIGHSLGGHLSLRYSLHHPDKICAMVLIAPFFTPRQISSPVRWMVRRPSLGIKALSRIPEHVIHVTAGWEPRLGSRLPVSARLQMATDLKRASPYILHILQSVPDLTPLLSNVHIPTQVIWGEKDFTLKPSLFANLVAALPSAVGRGLPGQGHLPHVGQPTSVNRMILDFLQSRMLTLQETVWQSN